LSSHASALVSLRRPPPSSTLFPYTTLFRSDATGNPLTGLVLAHAGQVKQIAVGTDASGNPELFAILLSDSQVYTLKCDAAGNPLDRKSTRLNSSHQIISYAVFCLKKNTS